MQLQGSRVGEAPSETGDIAEAAVAAAAARESREDWGGGRGDGSKTPPVRTSCHPGPRSPRHWGVPFLPVFFTPRETVSTFSVHVAEGGVAMMCVAVGPGSNLILNQSSWRQLLGCHLGWGLWVERALQEEIMTPR